MPFAFWGSSQVRVTVFKPRDTFLHRSGMAGSGVKKDDKVINLCSKYRTHGLHKLGKQLIFHDSHMQDSQPQSLPQCTQNVTKHQLFFPRICFKNPFKTNQFHTSTNIFSSSLELTCFVSEPVYDVAPGPFTHVRVSAHLLK